MFYFGNIATVRRTLKVLVTWVMTTLEQCMWYASHCSNVVITHVGTMYVGRITPHN
jgi:hypothetical protein